jgi:hypothetical protein
MTEMATIDEKSENMQNTYLVIKSITNHDVLKTAHALAKKEINEGRISFGSGMLSEIINRINFLLDEAKKDGAKINFSDDDISSLKATLNNARYDKENIL